jgi:alpha-ribazole phosphatase
MTRFWLIRHGQPAEEALHHCYGSLDIGLSETGRAQIAQVAEYLRTEPFAAIYASPRSRALESARILASVTSRTVEVIEDLREIGFGDFEGLAFDEIAARYPRLYQQWMETPTEIQFPNGESFAQMRVRVLKAFDAIQNQREGQTVAIVSHGGVNRILLARALEMPDHAIFRLAQSHAAINLLELSEGIPIVQSLNHTLPPRGRDKPDAL